MDWSQVLTVVEKLLDKGATAFLLGCVLLAAGFAIVWFAKNVLIPHFAVVNANMTKTTDALTKFTDSESRQCETLDRIDKSLGEQSEVLRGIVTEQKMHGRLLQQLSGEHSVQGR